MECSVRCRLAGSVTQELRDMRMNRAGLDARRLSDEKQIKWRMLSKTSKYFCFLLLNDDFLNFIRRSMIGQVFPHHFDFSFLLTWYKSKIMKLFGQLMNSPPLWIQLTFTLFLKEHLIRMLFQASTDSIYNFASLLTLVALEMNCEAGVNTFCLRW